MADYRLPMDADGVKYHGTVDQNEENPGQFMYGLDENGNKRIIRTDEQGNVLTRVTGSIVEDFKLLERVLNFEVPAGERIDVASLSSINYAKLFVAVRAGDINEFEIDVTSYVNEAGSAPSEVMAYNMYTDDFVGDSQRLYTKEPISVLGDRMRFFITNKDDEDMSYNIHIWGVRN